MACGFKIIRFICTYELSEKIPFTSQTDNIRLMSIVCIALAKHDMSNGSLSKRLVSASLRFHFTNETSSLLTSQQQHSKRHDVV